MKNGFQIYDFQVFPERNIIVGPDGEQKIEPKAMRVLLVLASQPEQVVSRQALLDEVWAETYSGDEALTRCISLLRTAFGGKQNIVIETVPKVGYRFVAPIAPLESTSKSELAAITTEPSENSAPQIEPPQQSQVDSAQQVRLFKFLLTFSIAALALVVLYVGLSNNQQPTDSISAAQDSVESSPELNAPKAQLEGTSIAVMPFVNMSGDADNEYFSDGISEEILNILAQVPNLKVISRSSAFSFKGKDVLLSEVASKLGVDNILEGSVRKSGDRVRITAQLIEAETDTHLWSQTYDRELTDIFAIQDDITEEIVASLKLKLGVEVNLAHREPKNLTVDAYTEYLKGRFFIANQANNELEKAKQHFSNTVELAPTFVPAWEGLAFSQLLLSEAAHGDTPMEVAYKNAQKTIEHALTLSQGSAETYFIAGAIESDGADKNVAIAYFEKALEISPEHMDAKLLLSRLSPSYWAKLDGLELLQNKQKLNPMSLSANADYAKALASYGDFEEAFDIILHMQSIDKNNPTTYAALAFIKKLQQKYAESAWLYSMQVKESNGRIGMGYTFVAISSLTIINLHQDAIDLINQTPYGFITPLVHNQAEEYLRILRQIFPRNENDRNGYQLLAHALAGVGQFNEAARNFEKARICRGCYVADIFSSQKANKGKNSRSFVEVKRSWLNVSKQKKLLFPHSPINFVLGELMPYEEAKVEYLEGDIEQSIALIQQAVLEGKIIPTGFTLDSAIFEEIRNHPKWNALLAQSNALVKQQQEIYAKLKQEQPSIEELLVL